MTLTEFLTARLDEDEAAAKRAASFRYDHPLDAPWERARLDIEAGIVVADKPHTARFTPGRVLADVDVRRRIVELHKLVYDDTLNFVWERTPDGEPIRPIGNEQAWGCNNCRTPTNEGDAVVIAGPCPTLRLLALPFASHPDYDESWKP